MIPEFLQDKLKEYYPDNYSDITDSYSKGKKESIRVNTIKCDFNEVISYLNDNNISYEEVDNIKNALVINNHIEILKESSLYDEGKIYFQSLSSQIPPFIVDPKNNEQILDMTAAPGGKTTEMAALSNNTAMITAIEKNKIRFDRLSYNIEKQGAKKVSVLKEDARNLNEYFIFDKILLDAPCSGSGTIINNDFSKISNELVENSVATQKELIKEAIKHLKVNGILVYSTCSILKDENENIVKEILDNNSNIVLEPIEFNGLKTLPTTLEGTITIMPNDYYEGFFVAKLKRVK